MGKDGAAWLGLYRTHCWRVPCEPQPHDERCRHPPYNALHLQLMVPLVVLRNLVPQLLGGAMPP